MSAVAEVVGSWAAAERQVGEAIVAGVALAAPAVERWMVLPVVWLAVLE